MLFLKKLLSELIRKYEKNIPEEEIFNLVTRHGLDYSIIEDTLNKENRIFDKERYLNLLQKHKDDSFNSNISSAFLKKHPSLLDLKINSEMDYESVSKKSKIISLLNKDFVSCEEIDGECFLILNSTVVFPISGGQDSDIGYVNGNEILNSFKAPNGQILHLVKGKFKVGDVIEISHNVKKRHGLKIHHTLEHLFYELLKREVDESIIRASGTKYENCFSFEISCEKKLDKKFFNLIYLNNKLKELIDANLEVKTSFITLEKSKEMGLPQQFEDVYKKSSSNLRLVDIGGYSKELCFGTHVKNTKEISDCLIVEFKKKQSNIYRFKLLAGKYVSEFLKEKNISKEDYLLKNDEDESRKKKLEKKEIFDFEKKRLLEELISHRKELVILEKEVDVSLALSTFKEIRSYLNKQTIFLFNREDQNYRFYVASDVFDLRKIFDIFRKEYG